MEMHCSLGRMGKLNPTIQILITPHITTPLTKQFLSLQTK